MRGTHVAAGIALALSAMAVAVAPARAAGPPAPVDPQNWSFQDNLTWSDYHPIPGQDYSDPSIQPSVKKWKVAIVLVDFPDKPFTITQPAGSTVFGTPTAEGHDIARADVPAFYRDFLNKPSALNHFQTMNRYWMEDSFGKYGVQLDAYGAYQLPGRSYQYFMTDQGGSTGGVPNNAAHCPTPAQTPCNRDFRTDSRAAWRAEVGDATIASYDNVFYVSAGEDESSTWQEFGPMKWMTQDQVPDPFGPKAFDPSQTNWAVSRYVPWSSWASASTIWPNAVTSGPTPLSSIEAESSGLGTYTHELTHNLGILDNYNNPFGTTQQVTATGMWDMMSRGSFNGPGGQHTRWLIPPTTGGSLGSQHNVRNKRFLNFISDNELLRLNRDGLAQSGMAVADVTAREVAPTGGELSGVQITLNGTGDNEPPCVVATNPLCDGVTRNAQGNITGKYNHYTMEVVQQIGSDSFDPGHGVLISKTKNASSSCGSYSCFVWVVDSHPEDINRVDFVRPDGTPQMATIGDERQKNDGSFNAGLNSGSTYEYEDAPNRLHFYVLDTHADAQGILHYTVGVKSLDGAGPQARGVSLASPQLGNDGGFTTCTFNLTNTGAAAATPNVHPQDASAYLSSDIYRLSASATGTGWNAYLKNAFASAKFGDSVKVPVYIEKGTGSGSITLKATSESDPSKTASAVCTLADSNVGGSVPATLALTLGTPASFGPLTPGLGKDYFATTNASVISTAGDALLTVADPSSTATGHLVNGAFSLPSALQASAQTDATTYAPIGGSASPTPLKSWSSPASNDPVAVSFKQTIGSNDALRTGTYAKTLTFTLSTTTP
jgi:M6 family metalloprotease-like protein